MFFGGVAMYSIVAYLIAAKLMDTVVDGFNQLSAFRDITGKVDEMGNAIVDELGKTITYLNVEGGYSGNQTRIIYVMVSLYEPQLWDLINDIDEDAFVFVRHCKRGEGTVI